MAINAYLGNSSPIGSASEEAVTHFIVPDDVKVPEAFKTITDAFASHHSSEPPTWIESDNLSLEIMLSEHYECPVGRPKETSS